jgi:hypothetical protein
MRNATHMRRSGWQTAWILVMVLALLLVACGSPSEAAVTVPPDQRPPRATSTIAATIDAETTTPAPTPAPSTPTPDRSSTMPTTIPTIDPSSPYADLLRKARQQGFVRVIVGLAVPFEPEGNLPDEAAIQAQRAAIAEAQNTLTQALQGHNARNISTFETIPSVAMEVDAAALEVLIGRPEVRDIQEDEVSAPSLSAPGG